jgi:hypothetical protein
MHHIQLPPFFLMSRGPDGTVIMRVTYAASPALGCQVRSRSVICAAPAPERKYPPLWALASACQVHARPAQIWMIGPAVGTPGNLGSPPDPCIRRYGRHAVAKVTRLCSAELVISGGECPVRCVLRGTVQRVEF